MTTLTTDEMLARLDELMDERDPFTIHHVMAIAAERGEVEIVATGETGIPRVTDAGEIVVAVLGDGGAVVAERTVTLDEIEETY